MENKTWLIGTCFTLGNDGDHSSFKSELAGIYTLLLTLYHLSHSPHLILHIRIACNAKSVLQRLQFIGPMDPMEAHADLLSSARTLLWTCRY